MQKSFLRGCILALFTGYTCLSLAQSHPDDLNRNERVPAKYWSIDLNAGMVIMPNKTSSELLGKRPTVGFQELFTANYAFNSNWALYGAIGINYYKCQKPAILSPATIGLHKEDILEGLFGSFESLKPTLNTGVMYRISAHKWEILPKLGLSYTTDDWGRDRTIKFKENGVNLHYKMNGTVLGLQTGINGHYWVSKKGYINFGLLAESPLQKPDASATWLRGQEVMSTTRIKSAAYGQNLYIQFGYGFAFARKYM